MKTNLVDIGNSKGIRIPKAIREQIGLGDKIKFTVKNRSIIIEPDDEVDESLLLSESSLAKLWDDPRENEAWKNL